MLLNITLICLHFITKRVKNNDDSTKDSIQYNYFGT